MKLSHIKTRAALTAVLATVGLAALLGACTKSPTNEDDDDELRAALIAEGEPLFETCAGCHGTEGEGQAGPPLRHSDFLIAERMRPVRILFLGLPNQIDTATTITVNGVDVEGNSMFAVATSSGWTNREVAAVLTYVRAVMNDSTSVNCVPYEDENGQMASTCDIVPSPASATTMITPEEVSALRDSLIDVGYLDP
jgi:mono/diheme cytochrome c family protein